MKILFLSFYFPPDLSAGSFRSCSLVNSLLSGSPETVQIEIITTLPNRYSSFLADASTYETSSELTIHRIETPQHNNSMKGQCQAFLAYVMGARRVVAENDFDLVYATSGRLMTAVLGAYFAKKLCRPLYLDIRDIFVDTIGDILPGKAGLILTPFFSLLERYALNSAIKVNLVSAGFLPYFKKRYPHHEFELFTNGIDDQFLAARSKHFSENKTGELTIVYAGNIGEGQGLHNIIPELAKKFSGKMLFKIVGDGARKRELVAALKLSDCQNVVVLPPVQRDELITIYQSADVLFLHLNDFDAFKNVLPSKLFEYAATGKPIWAGVAGYAAEFITTRIENSAVFPPCNVSVAASSFDDLEIVMHQRTDFVREFSRDKIMKKMAESIKSFGRPL